MSKYNPWCGLSAYKDPSKSENEYKFCGRDTEIVQLVNLIENDLFITLYGRTGVGKTSLLNAGVIPILRKRDFYPIYIRLSQECESNITYAQAIVNKIEKSDGLIKERKEVNNINSDGEHKAYLSDYFSITKFKVKYIGEESGKDSERYVYPVIILDQFEEIFITNKDKAELLLQQIYMLMSSDRHIPDSDEAPDETNYRFVASIREDNLFYLEDCIDELSLALYKNNRYRLKPLSIDNAKKAILYPGMGIISENEKDEITNEIINISKEEDGSISSLILSLICSLMYTQAVKLSSEEPTITLKQIPRTPDDANLILEDFYKNKTTKQQRRKIEENLLTDDGHRKAAAINIPNRENLLSEGCRILQRIGTTDGEKVEIVHDRMAKVIYEHRRRRDTNKFRNLSRFIIVVLLVVIGYMAFDLSLTTTNGTCKVLALTIKEDSIPTKVKFLTKPVIHRDEISSKDSMIKRVVIGDSVRVLDTLDWIKGLDVVVSPHNKHFKWDSIYSTEEGYIGYLYNVEEPTEAIYIQEYPSYVAKFRLPKGIDELKYKYRTFLHEPQYPHYGEKHIKASLYEDEIAEGLFRGDERIESIDFAGVQIVPEYSFRDCINLRKVDLNDVDSIGYNAFLRCERLKEVFLPEDEIKMGGGVFSLCSNLIEISLPRKLNGEPWYLFSGCYNLRSVVLPDEIEHVSDDIFSYCPNLEQIKYTENKHYRFDKDSILYYDSIPIIFNKCVKSDVSIMDSLYCINNGFIEKDGGLCGIINKFVIREWPKFGDIYFEGVNKNGKPWCYVWLNNSSEKLFLPVAAPRYYLMGMKSRNSIKEIHTPVVDPSNFAISSYGGLFSISKIRKREIILYVPWGTKDEYLKSGEYDEYKDIREDSLCKRISDIVSYYWRGIVGAFDAKKWIFYPLIIVGLCILTMFFYWLRIRQMKYRGRLNKRKALLEALLGVPVAVISFVPVYYLIYIYLMNHVSYKNSGDMNHIGMWLGSIAGIISSVLCSYLFIFSGKGKIWKSLKRMTRK